MRTTIDLPDELLRQAKTPAESAAFISTAAAEKLAALLTVDYLEERAKRGSREKFETALAALPDVEPDDFDKL
jgi:hypothetical protein